MYPGFQNDIEKLIEIFKSEPGAIQYGDFIFAGGNKSKNKIDAKSVLKNKEGAEIIGRLVSGKILELEEIYWKEYRIAGVANGGAKVAELAADVLGRDYVSLDPHENGKIIGDIHPIEHIICEDVTTLASSIKKCYEKFMLPKKAFARHAIGVVDRNEGASENLAKLGIEYHYFLKKEQLGVYEDSYL